MRKKRSFHFEHFTSNFTLPQKSFQNGEKEGKSRFPKILIDRWAERFRIFINVGQDFNACTRYLTPPLPRSLSQWRGRRAWLINDFLRKPRITRLGRRREREKTFSPGEERNTVAHRCFVHVFPRTRGDWFGWLSAVVRDRYSYRRF